MRLLPTIAIGLVLTSPALAKPPLSEVSRVDNGLMAVAIADEIRKTCDEIDARMVVAFATLNALKSEAQSLGYSDEEIEDYVTSKDEKRRMRAKAEAYLTSVGVNPKDDAALCRFGEAEIARQTAIGRLLR